MSNRREILLGADGPIEALATKVSAALHLPRALQVRTLSSERGSWRVAEGAFDAFPLVLMDTTDLEGEVFRGFGWYLSLDCRVRGGEAYADFEFRVLDAAERTMVLLGSQLRVRCALLDNLQTVVDEFPRTRASEPGRPERFTCFCCGNRTLPEKSPGSLEICAVCFWQDDMVGFVHPDQVWGPNTTTLNEARENFRRFGACDERSRDDVRPPTAEERPPNR